MATSVKAKPARKRPPAKKRVTEKASANRKKLARVKTAAIGRPSDFRAEYVHDVFVLCLAGFIDKQIAEVFEVSEVTLRSWKKKRPQFLMAMRKGKAIADAKVAHSLFNRAIGMTVEESREVIGADGKSIWLKTIKHLPPDVSAIKFWLKNRQPDKWKENFGVTDGQGGGFNLVIHECLRPPTETPEER